MSSFRINVVTSKKVGYHRGGSRRESSASTAAFTPVNGRSSFRTYGAEGVGNQGTGRRVNDARLAAAAVGCFPFSSRFSLGRLLSGQSARDFTPNWLRR